SSSGGRAPGPGADSTSGLGTTSNGLHPTPLVGYNTYIPVYDLVLDHDTNSLGHVQWFNFACRGFKRAQTIRFRIINACKGASLFQMGMRPLVWSETHAMKMFAAGDNRGSSNSSGSSSGSCTGAKQE
ncbi:unnamed protein product, partial [Amoebophrya sp. A120]